MKTAITTSLVALALTVSASAFAETGEAKKPLPAKVDMTTTQSIEPAGDAFNCDKGFTGFKAMKACGDANSYPVNALSGMNLN